MYSRFHILCLAAAVVVAMHTGTASAQKPAKLPLKAGIIGCDTSHVPAFTKAFNNPKAEGPLAGVKVVAAFPGGSPDLPDSANRVDKFTEQLKTMGIEICPSIDDLLKKVDVVLLESVDGRPHLAQANPVIAAGKPMFIDKPMAASLADGMEIFRLAKEKGVPVFSCSSLRFGADTQAIRNGKSPIGKVKSCVATSPMHVEPHHPDLFWYAIHGVETLFTIMGPGCKEVRRIGPEEVEGVWADGRVGKFVAGKGYEAKVVGTNGTMVAGKYDGYEPMLVEIAVFFKTGKPPVSPEETLEILAFMEAADASKALNGAPVSIESVMEKARQKNAQRAK